MRGRGTGRGLGPAAALSAVVLAACAPADGGPARFAPGWTGLPESPIPADRQGTVSFWAGDRLVVAGGADFGPEDPGTEIQDVQPTSRAVSYRPATDSWVAESPLVVPGSDGVLYAEGAWTGAAWLGVGLPCDALRSPVNEVPVACGLDYVGLRWRPADGWSVLDAPPAEALRFHAPDRPDVVIPPRPLGVVDRTVVFHSQAGFAVLDEQGHWSVTAWPEIGAPGGVSGRCVLDGEVWAAATDDPWIDAGGPVYETESLVAVAVATGDARVLWTGTAGYAPGAAVLCPAPGVLYQPEIQTGAVYAARGDAVRELPRAETPATQTMPPWPVRLLEAELVVGPGVVSLGGGGDGWYLDAASGALTTFPGAPPLSPQLWTGEHVYARLIPEPGEPAGGDRWFVLNPDGFGPGLRQATFPGRPG